MELLDSDLHRIIQSKQQLTENHYKHFFHQLLCGVKYLHDTIPMGAAAFDAVRYAEITSSAAQVP